MDKSLSPNAVYDYIVISYAKRQESILKAYPRKHCAPRAATTALDKGADIARVQDWLGHSNVSTTRLLGVK